MSNNELVKVMLESILQCRETLTALETEAKELYRLKQGLSRQLTKLDGPVLKKDFLGQLQSTETVMVTGPSCSGKTHLCFQMSNIVKMKKPRVFIDLDACQQIAWKRRIGPDWQVKLFQEKCVGSSDFKNEVSLITETMVLADMGFCVMDGHFTERISDWTAAKVLSTLVVFPNFDDFIRNMISRHITAENAGWYACEAWRTYLTIARCTRQLSQARTFWLYPTTHGYSLLSPLVAYESLTSWSSTSTVESWLSEGILPSKKDILDEVASQDTLNEVV